MTFANLLIDLEIFLPFDLDCLFSSMFALLVMWAIQPSSSDSNSTLERGQLLLTAMIRKGSATAEFRAAELSNLRELLRLAQLELSRAAMSRTGLPEVPFAGQPFGDDVQTGVNDVETISINPSTIGLSPNEMELVAQYLEWDRMFPGMEEPLPSGLFWETMLTDAPTTLGYPMDGGDHL